MTRNTTDKPTPTNTSRFIVRQSRKGWMVYDRERKGPALVGIDLAADLTQEQAERITAWLLTAGRQADPTSASRRGRTQKRK